MTVDEQTRLINIVAPALRALLAQGNTLGLVRFSDSDAEKSSSLEIELEPKASTKKIVETLATAIKAPAKSVSVKDLGVFTVIQGQVKPSRFAAKVAFITGSAQGVGLGIAQDLAQQGAYVVLADINESGARSSAQQLCETLGPDRAMGLAINVTDSESVSQAIDQTVRAYGGLDILISNAGVLKAQSVKTQPIEDFDFVTAVNYRGYFLCVQKAAPVMAVQHLAKPDYISDIIQINSKSGLLGSSSNSAYAGSKFGGIGLTQSFALELVSDGIKVNSICPGNFLDGPLWSDPKNGLFAQYLRAGKVPGAKTVQDVRKAYESKVPMGRGCEVSDLMKALYYLIEQKYETGQAIAVTGGQVMLR